MSSFLEYKKNRAKNFDKLADEVAKVDQKQDYNDDRFWYIGLDKEKNGYAVIRFLPSADGEEAPYTRYWEHSFKGPSGKWYMEKCRTTIGLEDPVVDYNTELWDTGSKPNQDQASKQKRKLIFVANVYVIEDSKNPENNGKVFMMKFGKKIFEMLKDAMNPPFKDKEKLNPFDLYEGANFRFKARQVDGWPNYEKSEFDPPAPLFTDDKKMEEVFSKIRSLKEFTDPTTFKSYEVLQAELQKVLKIGGQSDSARAAAKDEVKPAATIKEKEPVKQAAREPDPEPIADVATPDGGDDDDPLAYFANLTK